MAILILGMNPAADSSAIFSKYPQENRRNKK